MWNRRRLIATLGGLVGGAIGPARGLLGQTPTSTPTATPTATPTPTPTIPPACRPYADGLTLDYAGPSTEAGGITTLKKNFKTGLQDLDPSSDISLITSHLTKAYGDTFHDQFGTDGGLYKRKAPNDPIDPNGPSDLWVVANDHAYILGQMTTYYWLKKKNKPKPGPHHLMRAQVKFREATSSKTCMCYIHTPGNKDKVYRLPARPASAGPGTHVDDPCGGGGGMGMGQIDEECPFCG